MTGGKGYAPGSELYRVVWMECVGWPDPDHDYRQKVRTYDDRGKAIQKVVEIRAYPSHCQLVGVWQGEAAWAPIPESFLPQPEGPPDDR